jgi:hypothetical protein
VKTAGTAVSRGIGNEWTRGDSVAKRPAVTTASTSRTASKPLANPSEGEGQNASRQNDAALAESFCQTLTGYCQAAVDRPDRKPKPTGNLDLGRGFEFAKHQERSEFLGQFRHFLVQHCLDVVGLGLGPRNIRQLGGGNFASPTSGCHRTSLPCSSECNSVEPVPNCLSRPDRSRTPREHNERRLESILCILLMARYSAADSEHHRSVTHNQFGESCLVSLPEKQGQQKTIGTRFRCLRDGQLDAGKCVRQPDVWHGEVSGGRHLAGPYLLGGSQAILRFRTRFSTFFEG